MGFADEVRAYLEALDRTGSSVAVRHRYIDDQTLKAYFLGQLGSADQHLSSEYIAELHATWLPKLAELAAYLERLPAADAPVDSESAHSFARRTLDIAMGEPFGSTAELSTVEGLEILRIIAEFHRALNQPATYALENNLTVRPEAHLSPRLTPVARAFLRLRGKDAIRWLLTVETVQCRGPDDPWHIGKGLLEQAASRASIQRRTDSDGSSFGFAHESLDRGHGLGVLRAWANPPEWTPYRYDVPPEMRDVVDAVLATGPWHTAIGALLDDQRAAVLPGSPETTAISDITVEQGRMFAHEARNALVPARYHLDAVLNASGEVDRTRVANARRNVVQLLHFVEQLVATGELITERGTEAELGAMIAEALAQCEGAERVEALARDAAQVTLRVPRAQLVLAIANVVRNALQATPHGHVRICWWGEDDAARIDVDDDGPGVPVEDRVRIFDDGFTTRPGGTGFGLAYVKKVVGTSLRGKVWCERGDLGGACFSILIPSEPIP